MALNLSIAFPQSLDGSAVVASGLRVQRFELREALNELFELTLEVLSTDPAITESAIVGQPVVVHFGDEPFLRQIQGIVRAVVQRSSVPTGASRYDWIVAPPLWLTTRRRDHRIFQGKSVPSIVEEVLGGPEYGGRIPPPIVQIGGTLPAREYCVQYAETDYDFLSRILAEEGITTFFDHALGSAFTLIENTTTDAPPLAGGPIPFSDPANLNPILRSAPDAAHVSAVELTTRLETSAMTLRAHDFNRPRFFNLEAKRALPAARALPNEGELEVYEFDAGAFQVQPDGDVQATRRLQEIRAEGRALRCEASFALQPGSQMTLADHPRSELNTDLLAVRCETVHVFGRTATHVLECIERKRPFQPHRWPKPRIHGTQTAIVVGGPQMEIDVDALGRVEVEFHWDRRDRHSGGTSRRVRVSQGWAGAGFGFVMLPRVNDEVIVAYLDGDPDEPLVVGRVHNAASITPLQLPAEKAISVWRSCSSPGGGGFNQVLMDDQAGMERMELHAQRDFKQEVGRHALRCVTGNDSGDVGGDVTRTIKGDLHVNADGGCSVTAGVKFTLASPIVDVYGTSSLHLTTLERLDDSVNHVVKANGVYVQGAEVVQVSGPRFHVFCDEIVLKAGGSSIRLAGDDITITAAGTVDVHGATIKLNC